MPDAVKVHVYDDGVLLGSPTVDGAGNWALNAASVAAGSSTITAKSEDAAGNMSGQTTKKVYTGSTTKPTCDLLDDSGQSSSDNITNDDTPRIKVLLSLLSEQTAMGVAADALSVASLILERSSDGGVTWSQLEENTAPTVAGSNFDFTHQITVALGDGTHLFRAAWKDAKGNQSAWGTTLTITVDTTAPNSPVVDVPADGQVYVGTSIDINGTAT